MFMNMYVHGYVYVYDSICWALKCPVHCAEPFLELKICISPQFRAIDPPNPARGFIQQNENVRFATAACMQKYGNVSFATVACAKCMRYGGRGGGPMRGEIPRGCPGIWTPQAVNSSFTRRIASAKSWAKRCQKTHVCGKVQLYSKVDSIHVQALRRSMSIKGFPKRLKTGNKQTQFSLDRSMPFQNCGQMIVRMLYKISWRCETRKCYEHWKARKWEANRTNEF